MDSVGGVQFPTVVLGQVLDELWVGFEIGHRLGQGSLMLASWHKSLFLSGFRHTAYSAYTCLLTLFSGINILLPPLTCITYASSQTLYLLPRCSPDTACLQTHTQPLLSSHIFPLASPHIMDACLEHSILAKVLHLVLCFSVDSCIHTLPRAQSHLYIPHTPTSHNTLTFLQMQKHRKS